MSKGKKKNKAQGVIGVIFFMLIFGFSVIVFTTTSTVALLPLSAFALK